VLSTIIIPACTTILFENALFVVAFFPFSNPVPARIQDPLHTVKMYFAPGACCFRNSMSDGSIVPPGVAAIPVRKKAEVTARNSGDFTD
jgi:hypothetical protein